MEQIDLVTFFRRAAGFGFGGPPQHVLDQHAADDAAFWGEPAPAAAPHSAPAAPEALERPTPRQSPAQQQDSRRSDVRDARQSQHDSAEDHVRGGDFYRKNYRGVRDPMTHFFGAGFRHDLASDDLKEWDQYVNKGRRIRHSDFNPEKREAAQGGTGLYRGLQVEADVDDLTKAHERGGMGAVHKHIADLVSGHQLQEGRQSHPAGVGTHWTTDRAVADEFSRGIHAFGGETEPPRTRSPYNSSVHIPVMIHGQVAPEHRITDKDELRGAMVQGHGYTGPPGRVENETLVRKGAPVSVTGMTASLPSHPDWVHHLSEAHADWQHESWHKDSGAHSWQDIGGGGQHVAHVLTDWVPTERLFAPTQGELDPRLFAADGSMLPNVTKTILDSIDKQWAAYGDWLRWARVYLAGSQASFMWGNRDFDMLVGVDYDVYRNAHPEDADLSNEAITARFNEGFRATYNDDDWHPDFDPTEAWSRTGYCNQDSYDIRAIKPYAAYCVSEHTWYVKPQMDLEGHHFSPTEWYYFESVGEQVKAALATPEPGRSVQLDKIWHFVHSDRSRAFGPKGSGAFDRGNVLEKWLDQAGLMGQLSKAHFDYAKTEPDWEKTAARKPVRRDPATGIEMCHKKVDGFPCKHLLGHTQGCDVDWNAAYPDEPDEPQAKQAAAEPETHSYYRGLNLAGKGSEDVDWDNDESVLNHLQTRVSRYTSKATRGSPKHLPFGSHYTTEPEIARRFSLNTQNNMGRAQKLDPKEPVHGAVLEVKHHDAPTYPEHMAGYGEKEVDRPDRPGTQSITLHLHRHDPSVPWNKRLKETHVRSIEVPASHWQPTDEETTAHLRDKVKFHKEFRDGYAPGGESRNRSSLSTSELDEMHQKHVDSLASNQQALKEHLTRIKGKTAAVSDNWKRHYGTGDLKPAFGEASKVMTPFTQTIQRKAKLHYDKALVHQAITDPDHPVEKVDTRNLESTQPDVTRAGVEHYMGDDYARKGMLYSDHSQVGNQVPVVYHWDDGHQILLSGHHRATAAFLRGEPLEAKVVQGPWGPDRKATL